MLTPFSVLYNVVFVVVRMWHKLSSTSNWAIFNERMKRKPSKKAVSLSCRNCSCASTVKSDFLVLSSSLSTLVLCSVLLVLHFSQHRTVDVRAVSILACVHSNTSSFKGCFNKNVFLFVLNFKFFLCGKWDLRSCVTRSLRLFFLCHFDKWH